MPHVTLSSKFQLSIPNSLRNELGLQSGQRFSVVARGNIIELIPIRPIQEARGMLSDLLFSDSSEYRDRVLRNT